MVKEEQLEHFDTLLITEPQKSQQHINLQHRTRGVLIHSQLFIDCGGVIGDVTFQPFPSSQSEKMKMCVKQSLPVLWLPQM